MAWICVDLDDTLVQKQPVVEPETIGDEESVQQPELQDMPVEGAVEAMTQLVEEGHRLTVFTARFAAMPASEKQRVKEEIEQTLQMLGFPEMDVWTGTFKPAADLFIDNNAVNFSDDWPLALAQAQQMLEDRGLAQGPVPGAAEQGIMDEQPPPEEGM
jgi:hypothetical protein